ncbi:hypothetical protein QJS04_geneDACA010297 [Acorus gramineus]|uniref:Uncharacterized protein n=1 Tax=Acorus gramineus TaxID=55184 RepID=A0AAV9A670_ACOGR|nr:hypothetical protein QJS04_geneDACA010297 [Acorus gramineus]
MEPADIDWKNVVSRFEEDEAFEHINAPKWIDLSKPDSALVDDEAWFCRPDCRHPKTVEDFLNSSPVSKMKQLRSKSYNATNLKRRGFFSSPQSLKSSPKMKPPKSFNDDIENADPNGLILTAKEMIKSSAQKKKPGPSDATMMPSDDERKPPSRLRSTLSARNLFAGKDLLSQISEFCSELKKLARRASDRDKSKEDLKVEVKDKEPLISPNSKAFTPEPLKKKMNGGIENIKIDVPLKENGSRKDAFSQVRACPPTPQRIPSPLSRRKPARTTPLKPSKPPIQERGVLKELEAKALVADEGNNNIPVSNTEARSMDVFWFFKPCTYLAK